MWQRRSAGDSPSLTSMLWIVLTVTYVSDIVRKVLLQLDTVKLASLNHSLSAMLQAQGIIPYVAPPVDNLDNAEPPGPSNVALGKRPAIDAPGPAPRKKPRTDRGKTSEAIAINWPLSSL